MGTVVHFQNITKSFGERQLFGDVTFEMAYQENIALLGPGGCGKSTLLKMLCGLVQPDSGTLKIFDEDLETVDLQKRRELLSKVGMAFQQGALFDFMTVRENILFALENMTELHTDEMERRVTQLLVSVNLPNAADRYPSELSGGMRRRVGLLRALAIYPKLALLDEPTAGLDPVTSQVVIQMILKLAQTTGSTLLCVTSSPDVAFSFAPKVLVLRDGHIVGSGDKHALQNHSDPWIQKFVNARRSDA